MQHRHPHIHLSSIQGRVRLSPSLPCLQIKYLDWDNQKEYFRPICQFEAGIGKLPMLEFPQTS